MKKKNAWPQGAGKHGFGILSWCGHPSGLFVSTEPKSSSPWQPPSLTSSAAASSCICQSRSLKSTLLQFYEVCSLHYFPDFSLDLSQKTCKTAASLYLFGRSLLLRRCPPTKLVPSIPSLKPCPNEFSTPWRLNHLLIGTATVHQLGSLSRQQYECGPINREALHEG